MSSFRGSWVALITPFHKKGGIHWTRLEELIEWHISQGTDGLVLCGTTGEGPCLSETERKKITAFSVEVARHRIPIFVGTGSNDTRRTVRETEAAQKLGVDGCLVVTPYYNKPSQRGCILHFKEVAKVGLPLILYHIPGRTAVRLQAETIVEIAGMEAVKGLKDSTRDLGMIRQIRKLVPDLAIFSGDDDFTLPLLKEGGVGVISVIGNVIPAGWKKMVHLGLEGKWAQADLLARRYLPFCKALFLETNPQCVKYLLSWIGKCESRLRLPLVEPPEEVQVQLKGAFLSAILPQISTGGMAAFNFLN
jgi:4-hydroxy-tetrahydrodipicolinate synthase